MPEKIPGIDGFIVIPETTQDENTMPTHVHGEQVESAFRHMPVYGRLDYTYTVITRSDEKRSDGMSLYNVFRARFAPLLGRWSVDTDYDVNTKLIWHMASQLFARAASRASQDN